MIRKFCSDNSHKLQKKIEKMREILFPKSDAILNRYRVDYHFHPNLPDGKKEALDKCKNWWHEFESKGINVVIITEHVYKSPERAFKMMQMTKPVGSYVFPGMEYLTKEGIDIIMFAKTPKIYDYDALKSYHFTFEETLDFAAKHHLNAFITHPYTLGNTSIVRKRTPIDYVKFVNRVKSLEVTNTAFNQLLYLLDKPVLRQIFSRVIHQIINTRKVPFADYPHDAKLITAGSDAHNLGELGTHVLIKSTKKDLFASITNNIKPIIVENYTHTMNASLFFLSILTCFSEGWIKYKIRMRMLLKAIKKWIKITQKKSSFFKR